VALDAIAQQQASSGAKSASRVAHSIAMLPHRGFPWLARIATVMVACALACQPARPPTSDVTAASRDRTAALPPILDGLRTEHPRLLATRDDLEQLRQRVRSDPHIAAWAQSILKEANLLLRQPPARYEIPDGKRLLTTSRRVLRRIQTLAMAYWLSDDRAYVRRAWEELSAVAAFKDWNPSHFLDTAEMTHAVALGYDWLYAAWSPTQRKVLVDAIVRLGLEPGLRAYRGEGGEGWWGHASNNWNQVCNAGLVIGALAVADEHPSLAASIIEAAIKSLPIAMAAYAPDGGISEGPGYWEYASTYTAFLLGSLETSLGRDFGVAEAKGFAETIQYPLYMTGPSGKQFAYADMDAARSISPLALWWLARHTNQPLYARIARRLAKPTAYDLLNVRPDDFADPDLSKVPLDKYWRGLEAVSMRGAWGDPNTTFVAFKAGTNKLDHGHLDLGTFVLDALGEQWIVDLGSDDYNLPGYFGDRRFDYYRTRAEGHNTLVVGAGTGPDQDPAARASLTRVSFTPDRAFAIADLTSAYAGRATSVRRGVALVHRKDVVIHDEVRATKPTSVWWFMHTRAHIELGRDGRSAVLKQNGKRIFVTITVPSSARVSVVDARPLAGMPDPAGQNLNAAYHKLAINVPYAASYEIEVTLSPERTGSSGSSKLLDDW
jgi:hypothetical protein